MKGKKKKKKNKKKGAIKKKIEAGRCVEPGSNFPTKH
jgi:hypothetical protein